MRIYRKSLLVLLLYAIPAIIVSLICFGTVFVMLEGFGYFEYNTYGLWAAGVIAALVVSVYIVYQTSIRVEIDGDSITIKRLFKTRFEGFLDETQIRAYFTTSNRLFKPSGILLFVKDSLSDDEIRIVANGLGESRTHRLFEDSFNEAITTQGTVLMTQRLHKEKNNVR